MASSTYFGWAMPDNTALVKDGADAIRTLGNAIDATSVAVTVNAQTGATYTIVLADALNKIITMDNASANALKIPTDASVAFPVGAVINLFVKGAGTTTISAVTPGTTTISSSGASAVAPTVETKKSASCVKIAANSWIVVGSIG